MLVWQFYREFLCQNRNVTLESGALHKRVLFETWLEAHRGASAVLALAGEPIDRRRFLARVTSLAGQQRDEEYIYMLLEQLTKERDTFSCLSGSRKYRVRAVGDGVTEVHLFHRSTGNCSRAAAE